jgi:hypothetical protein
MMDGPADDAISCGVGAGTRTNPGASECTACSKASVHSNPCVLPLLRPHLPSVSYLQFRSLSDQLFHTEAHHGRVRARVVAQLQQHSELYKDYVTTEYAAYCR